MDINLCILLNVVGVELVVRHRMVPLWHANIRIGPTA